MLRIFQRETQTRDDPIFGTLTGQWGWFGPVRLWEGSAKTDLFPDRELTLELEVSSDADLESHGKHFKQLLGNSADVRKAMEESVWEYFQIYREAEPDLPYRELNHGAEIWELLSPSFWRFPTSSGKAQDHDSWIGLNIEWPNPHDLVAYFSGDTLTVVGCEG